MPQRLQLPTGVKRWLKSSSSSAFFLDTWIWVVDFHPSSGPTTSLVSPTVVLMLPSFFQLSITPLWGPNILCSQLAKTGKKRGQVSATKRVCLPRVLHKGACAAGGTTLLIPGGPAEVRACFQFCPIWAGTFSMSNEQESVLWAATVRSVQTSFLSNDNLPKNKQCFAIGKISQVRRRRCGWVKVWAGCQGTWKFNSLTQQSRGTKTNKPNQDDLKQERQFRQPRI